MLAIIPFGRQFNNITTLTTLKITRAINLKIIQFLIKRKIRKRTDTNLQITQLSVNYRYYNNNCNYDLLKHDGFYKAKKTFRKLIVLQQMVNTG